MGSRLPDPHRQPNYLAPGFHAGNKPTLRTLCKCDGIDGGISLTARRFQGCGVPLEPSFTQPSGQQPISHSAMVCNPTMGAYLFTTSSETIQIWVNMTGEIHGGREESRR